MNYSPYVMFGKGRSMVYGKSIPKLLNIARERGLEDFEIFKSDSNFHSTTQSEYLILWAEKNGYWAAQAKEQPSLLSKMVKI